MNGYGIYGSSEEHQPVTYFRGHPLYASHFVVVVLVATMLVATILKFAEVTAVRNWLMFDSDAVLGGQVWRVLTYGLVNPASIGFAIDMVMLVWFGHEVEKMLGRVRFFALYGGFYLLTPLVLTLIGLSVQNQQVGQPGTLPIFVAFATLYPSALLLFNILAKWAAWIIFGILSLIAFGDRNWPALLVLWSTCGFAYGFIRWHQGAIELPRLNFLRRKPRLRVLPDLPPRKPEPPRGERASMAEIDALLDKIAHSGLASLTPQERAKLDAAREGLRKKTR